MRFTPRPYQQIALDFLLSTPRGALWAGMGMGKTSTTLLAIDALQLVEPEPVLVLAPKRVAASTWPDEASKWEQLRSIEVTPVIGSHRDRHRTLFAALKRGNSGIFATNYDNLPWLAETLSTAGVRWPFGTVVADEATRLKSFRLRQGGKRAQALGKVAHKHVRRFIELTGTPSPNGLADLWGQAWFLDAGVRLGRTFDAFRQRWFRPTQDGYGSVPLPFAQEQIQAALRDLCLTLDPADWFDLEQPIVTNVYVDLPVSARKHYRDMEREMFTLLQGHEVEAFGAADRTLKCLQLANGAAYVDDATTQWKELHDAKLQALDSIVEEAAGAPVLVAYHFKSDLARLRRAFPQGRELDADPRTLRAWNAGQIPLLFAHPASAGHGLNLQDGGNILVYFAHWWNLEERQQILERIGPVRQKQAGHQRPVFVYNIVARDTVDELVMARVETKREVQDLLLEAMKQRRA